MQLPDANSPSLHLSHPTESEKTAILTLNSKSWGTALALPDYLDRETHMTTVPDLTRNDGLTYFVLVDKNSMPDSRLILGSLETTRKRALIARNGQVWEVISHAIGSVFCNPEYRGKGYAGRMLRELGPVLNKWQTDEKVDGRKECAFSILYSDIGKKYYAKFGWMPFPSTHISFPPSPATNGASTNGHINDAQVATTLKDADIEALCALDEQYIRKELVQAKDGKTHVALVPDYAQMKWHALREDFMTARLFSKSPTIRGAISGTAGNRVWALWTRSFYGPLDSIESGNMLHFLRLVIEDEKDVAGNVKKLRDIVKIAQKEAAEWKLTGVEIWNPTPVVKEILSKLDVEHSEVERDEHSIPCLLWYGEDSVDDLVWVGNEKFGWV
ncbi:Lysine acetyltransferase [Hyphodiscus hymeniophilus]|uniref:Lysine acetyltransferase n=1 Tax=Hyphodiscus hymeniophilus TaxID=353542 RepID=A0A9P7B0I9_9HELO|nr:Lysine acetyltransferase [Hyphodiscus hymeniophilus]